MVLLKMKRNGCTNGATLENVLLFPATVWGGGGGGVSVLI